MDKKILITGITGNVGSEVARFLIEAGHPVKGAVVEGEFDKVKAMFGDTVEPVLFDFENTDTFKIVNDNVIFAPAGMGKTSFIDVRDIAQVGAMALMDASHRNKAYSLTGSQALDYAKVAGIMSRELGRTITYANPSVREFRKRLMEKGMSKSYITVLTGIFLTARFGLAKVVTPDAEKLLGRAPITMEQFVKDYSHMWKQG